MWVNQTTGLFSTNFWVHQINKGTHTNTKEREKVIAFSQKTSYFFVAMVLRNPKRFLLNPSWKDRNISYISIKSTAVTTSAK